MIRRVSTETVDLLDFLAFKEFTCVSSEPTPNCDETFREAYYLGGKGSLAVGSDWRNIF